MNCIIGKSIDELDTPVLLVDLDVLERNISTMAHFIREHGVAWRPHIKGHKCPPIAHKQLAAGAIGITCAKLGEAEIFAAAGITDILIANQIVGPIKMRRLMSLCRHADVIVAVDSLENLRELEAAAAEARVRPRVVIEVDIGMGRCGVQPGKPTVALAQAAAACRSLRMVGLMGWEGHALAIEDPGERVRAIWEAVQLLVETAEACRNAGVPVEIVSCGGSGTFRWSTRVSGITEIQAGGGIFGDLRYQEWGAGTDLALTVLTTVISRPTPRRLVVDAGLKAVSALVPPVPIDLPRAVRTELSAEHGVFEFATDVQAEIGARLQLAVGYHDLTVFLHDVLYGVRQGVVETVWPVAARGRLQ